ncbi:MAG: ABC transporter permease, partial [Deltaproteobacteria bacterium]
MNDATKKFLRLCFIFLKRDFLINMSYRFAFMLDLGGIFFSTVTFFFIAKLFGNAALPYLSEYNTGYFPFVLIGIAFSEYLYAALNTFMDALREEQITGTLENILSSPIRISSLLICGSLWNFIFTSFRIALYLIIGWLLFGFDISNKNYLSSFTVIILTVLSFSGLGMLSGSFILIFKKGEPINFIFSGLSRFLGGVYFPIIILPLWIQNISLLLPITYALDAMRKAVLNNADLFSLRYDIACLIIFTALFLPLGIFSFRLALLRAKKEGSLLYY